ncbi:MAG: sensor histidine kinase [Rhodoferax sp.]|nr:sensor histidine kinase [Rhodoferax sp.]
MLRLLALLLFHLLCFPAYSGPSVHLSASDIRHAFAGTECSFLRDQQGQWHIEDVASPAFASKFQDLARPPSFGYTKDVIWLRITLQRESDAPEMWSLEVTNPFINDLQFFTLHGGRFSASQAGDRFAFASRQIAFHHPVFKVALPDTKEHTFYLRMASDSSLSSQLLLWQPTALRDAGQQEIILLGGLLGMVVMSFLISLVHWASNRDPSLLRFCGLTVMVFFFIPAQLGLWSQFVFMHQPLVGDLLVPWTLAWMVAAVLVVFGKALEIPKTFPRVARLLQTMFVVCLLLPLTRELDLYWLIGGPVLQILFMASLAITGGISLLRWQAKIEGSAYIVAAHVVLIASLLTGRLMLLGMLPVNAVTYTSWIPGTLAFLLLVYAGIVTDALIASRERAAALKESGLAKEIAAQEQRLRKEQSVFFSFVAHELRSPLGVIVAGLKNLRRELTDSGLHTDSSLRRMVRATQRMDSLIERHLHLQRLASGDFAPNFSTVSPLQPASDALVDVRAAYPERVFDLSYPFNLPSTVEIDSELITLAIGNLLTNAAKYSPIDGVVRLDVCVDSMLRYCVSDRGPGISTEEQSRLFQVFQRSSSARGKVGFGIGLATAKRVAEVHGGALAYEDGKEGGARFSLSLPLQPLQDVKDFAT